MLGVLSLREVGALLTAIMVAGRSGSAFTAEIGSMKMREEIDAMRTIGIDPVEVLVLPRVLALLLVVPLLSIIAVLMCFLGGGMMAHVYLGLDWTSYVDNLHASMQMDHFIAGISKTPFIALIIGIVGCMEGFKVEGSAESLGYHVTVSVVKAIFLVIVVDALFAMFMAAIGV
jgi:phospholipid/cholesterol/gamma-HCH transport system permease protein